MCWSEMGDSTTFQGILHAENVNGILVRLWSRMKSYVMKWKPLGN